MFQKIVSVVVLILVFLTNLSLVVSGKEVDKPNNIFGIHVATPSREELEDAARLVNGSGGAWGYVTVVIQDNDRDLHKWQEAFDRMRELRLVPIVRIATHPVDDHWVRPTVDDAQSWVDFLTKLSWVVKKRYIVLFNEPNHALEWGGTLDPQGFADVSYTFAKRLKQASPDFFVMLAGMDAAAPQSPPNYLDEGYFLSQMVKKQPEIFSYIDGLASHSYPNPGFSGSPYESGRNTIMSYEWELSLLSSLQVERDLPVFITETGWKHNGAGEAYLSPSQAGANLEVAYARWREDPRVMAVTPFILSYQGAPFLSFSFQKQNTNEFYDQYTIIQSLPKIHGAPTQDQKGELKVDLPHQLLAHSTYRFPIRLVNEGQAVWSKDDRYNLLMTGYDPQSIDYFFADIPAIRPHEEADVDLYIKTSDTSSFTSTAHIGLYRAKEKIFEKEWAYTIEPPPTLTFQTSLFPRIRAKEERNFEIQIFDSTEQLVYKKKGLKRIKGQGSVGEIQNVYLDGKYRVVILSDYYLPRQTFVRFQKGENIAVFKPMLPLDFNKDGTFNGWDLVEIFKNPRVVGLFLP